MLKWVFSTIDLLIFFTSDAIIVSSQRWTEMIHFLPVIGLRPRITICIRFTSFSPGFPKAAISCSSSKGGRVTVIPLFFSLISAPGQTSRRLFQFSLLERQLTSRTHSEDASIRTQCSSSTVLAFMVAGCLCVALTCSISSIKAIMRCPAVQRRKERDNEGIKSKDQNKSGKIEI